MVVKLFSTTREALLVEELLNDRLRLMDSKTVVDFQSYFTAYSTDMKFAVDMTIQSISDDLSLGQIVFHSIPSLSLAPEDVHAVQDFIMTIPLTNQDVFNTQLFVLEDHEKQRVHEITLFN